MKNRALIQERYLRDPLPVRIGGLAANLARIESFSNRADHADAVEKLIEESKYFIEWIASDVDLPFLAELVDLQRLLAAWQLRGHEIWADPEKRNDIARQAGEWSRAMLNKSGLLG